MSDKRQDLIYMLEAAVLISRISGNPAEIISAVAEESRQLSAENAQLKARIEQLDTSLSNMASRAARGCY